MNDATTDIKQCVDEMITQIRADNPDNAHTIFVSVNALPAHLAHGDSCGLCEEDDDLLLSVDESEVCSADVNGDGVVNAADLALLLGSWGQNPGHPADLGGDGVVDATDLALLLGSRDPNPTSASDLNDDAVVDADDLTILLSNWGVCP